MPRYRLTIAYDGTDFHGWQRQEPPGKAPLRTVQGVLDDAVRLVVREPVSVVGASRTDAGVHALGQVAAFTASTRIPTDKLPMAISSRLPRDVQVRSSSLAPDDFDPISDAISKSYRYTIAYPTSRPRIAPLFDRNFVYWQVHQLDVAAMNAAAQRLIGEHDFTALAHAVNTRESPVRRIHSCVVATPSPGRITIDVAGNGFLYNMVRVIAGTLVDVGRGQKAPDEVSEIVASRDRTRAGQTLPPQGLCLRWIHYGGKDVLSEP
ncbi:MAG: tRNA pseudouridine(38-40) synthase TruA [Phycisphaerae bacterium]|nr:tRNA pseudouridine(38-40) synthase TruA [Phycisphaerae bacterium]